MALRRDKLFALKWGELPQKTGADYLGGTPLQVDANGVFTAATALDIIGISANCAAYDLKYNGKATYYFFPCILCLYDGDQGVYGTPEIADGFPYDTTLAWVAGDGIFWNSSTKLWQRTAATAHDPKYGIVLEVGANKSYLLVQFDRIDTYSV